jgi:hypothetical protein
MVRATALLAALATVSACSYAFESRPKYVNEPAHEPDCSNDLVSPVLDILGTVGVGAFTAASAGDLGGGNANLGGRVAVFGISLAVTVVYLLSAVDGIRGWDECGLSRDRHAQYLARPH